ncbi:MAG: LURP-one-related family protein [Firmicutes bacterium]|nr:LURP-one-related family protein [Bacillota bacterium]
MIYKVKQKIFSVRDGYHVFDQYDNRAFHIMGKFFSIGKKFRFLDMSGSELFFIKQKLFRLFPTYEIWQGGQRVALFKGKFRMFGKKAVIKSEQYGDFKLWGSVMGWNFRITNNGAHAMEISKKLFRLSDTYAIDIADGLYDPFMLAVATVVDCAYHGHRQGKR